MTSVLMPCRVCGTPTKPAPKGKPRYCPPCKAEVRAEMANRRAQRAAQENFIASGTGRPNNRQIAVQRAVRRASEDGMSMVDALRIEGVI